jgi:hypothetical protein
MIVEGDLFSIEVSPSIRNILYNNLNSFVSALFLLVVNRFEQANQIGNRHLPR